MEDREGVDSQNYKRNSDPPDSSHRSSAGLGTIIITGVIGAAIIGNVLSLRKRLTNFTRMVGQVYSWSERPGTAAQQAARRAQQQQRRPVVEEEDIKQFWERHVREMERFRRVQEAWENERRRNNDDDPRQDAGGQNYTQTWECRWEGGRWVWQRSRRQLWTEGDRRWADEGSQWQRNQSDAHPSLNSSRHHYRVLGLDPSRKYTDAEIKAAFRAKALEYHPDRNLTKKDEAAEKFRQITEAYNALKRK